jgi:hypothetical protein
MNDYETQDELESRCKETAVTYFTALPEHLPGGSEWNHT